jgi:hypothetical protein
MNSKLQRKILEEVEKAENKKRRRLRVILSRFMSINQVKWHEK